MLNRTKNFGIICGFALIGLAIGLSSGCTNYGEKIVNEGTEVYYDGEIVKKETAEKLGQYLKDSGFSDGNEKSVRLAKVDGTWQFQMVVEESFVTNEEYHQTAAEFAKQMSADLFNGEPVEVHLCDEYLKTQKVVKASE